ncbi:flagellar motor protein MotB [Aquabacterium sp.]|uniref:flagellar motor protein MotB n=1 Tax=Aquabacterium sp. TaxID=1872578 RepID=UPI0035C6B979
MQSLKSDKSHGEAVIKRVSRKHDDEGHGGAWKVAFADFCLALMCLFLVMWVLAARNQERAEEVMRAVGGQQMDEGRGVMPESMGGPRGSLISREPLPRDPDAQPRSDDRADKIPTRKVRYDSAADLAELAQVLQRLSEDAGLGGNLQSVITPHGLRVMVHDTDKQGMFVRGSATPSERFRRLLRDMGPLFARIDNQMLVVGHTDAVQYAGMDNAAFSNWALSTHRAMAARSQLLAGGMPTASILQVVGMADRAPLDTQDPKAGVNRRIELLILTTAQARNISAMFGMPTQVTALTEGVDAVAPDAAALQTLRQQLGPHTDPAGAH